MSRRQVSTYGDLRRWCKQAQSKQSIILISHQERIMQLADEIIIIENGRMKTRGTREAILPSLMNEFEPCGLKK